LTKTTQLWRHIVLAKESSSFSWKRWHDSDPDLWLPSTSELIMVQTFEIDSETYDQDQDITHHPG